MSTKEARPPGGVYHFQPTVNLFWIFCGCLAVSLVCGIIGALVNHDVGFLLKCLGIGLALGIGFPLALIFSRYMGFLVFLLALPILIVVVFFTKGPQGVREFLFGKKRR